jgi:hypothetical protein
MPLTCSKCNRDPWRAIVVYEGDPPKPGEKDDRAVRIVRFCPVHWDEIEVLIPKAA